jgi:hypothetical protein
VKLSFYVTQAEMIAYKKFALAERRSLSNYIANQMRRTHCFALAGAKIASRIVSSRRKA